MITEMIELAVKDIKTSIIYIYVQVFKENVIMMWDMGDINKPTGNSSHEKYNIWNENFTRWEWLHIWHYKRKVDLKTKQYKNYK